jgi:hypothetical protein
MTVNHDLVTTTKSESPVNWGSEGKRQEASTVIFCYGDSHRMKDIFADRDLHNACPGCW